jgi:hypothetical protein
MTRIGWWSSIGPAFEAIHFDGVDQQRSRGVERHGEPVKRRPGGIA